MKNKHNKKRNTALVYEALVKEMTAAILRDDHNTKNKITNIIKKHFSFDSILKKDLECYHSVTESYGSDIETCKKIINGVGGVATVMHTMYARLSGLLFTLN